MTQHLCLYLESLLKLTLPPLEIFVIACRNEVVPMDHRSELSARVPECTETVPTLCVPNPLHEVPDLTLEIRGRVSGAIETRSKKAYQVLLGEFNAYDSFAWSREEWQRTIARIHFPRC